MAQPFLRQGELKACPDAGECNASTALGIRSWSVPRADPSTPLRASAPGERVAHLRCLPPARFLGVKYERMTQEAAELLKKALSLPASERADLAGSLIESLDDAQDEAVAAAWDEEVARRMAEIDSGTVKPVSLEEARRSLLSALE